MVMVAACSSAMPVFDFQTDEASPIVAHRTFGMRLGEQHASLIKERFAAKAGLRDMLREANTTDGSALFRSFLALHEQHYPLAIAELRGLADGSGVPFPAIFLQNVPEEFAACAAQLPGRAAAAVRPAATSPVDACSDLMVCGDGEQSMCAVAHNEDNNAEDRGTLILVRARFGARSWVAATYAGELSSGAFAFSRSGGFGYTLNWVDPTNVVCTGVARGFVSHALLAATSFDAAVDLATSARMASGHNYQLFQTAEPARVINLEVAPRGLYAVRPIDSSVFFHANQFETLTVPQTFGNSSVHRLKRVAELLHEHTPATTADLLHILGDQEDRQWPIFHDERSHARGDLADWTIATALIE